MVPRTPSPLDMMEDVMQSLTTRYTDDAESSFAACCYSWLGLVGGVGVSVSLDYPYPYS
jgi:hypothetical protein